jgi:hypothetical protein
MALFTMASGLVGVLMMAIGTGHLVPVGHLLGEVCELMAAISCVICCGLLDGA